VLAKRARAVARALWIERHGVIPVCSECSCKKADIHHRDGDVWNNKDSNHKPLCRSCHIRYENSIRCWITDGKVDRRVLFKSKIQLGWHRGRKRKPRVERIKIARTINFTHGTLYGTKRCRPMCQLCKNMRKEYDRQRFQRLQRARGR
jgi:hypothetical protein